MWKFLGLPEKNKVLKTLGLEAFLNKSNITEAERSIINKFVSAIEIVYDMTFPDRSEMVLLDVTITYRQNQWTSKEIARIVASSIPYQSIVYVHDSEYGSLSGFIRRTNEHNCFRSKIEKQATIPEYSTFLPSREVTDSLKQIGRVLQDTYLNAEKAADLCVDIIESARSLRKIQSADDKKEQLRATIKEHFIRYGYLGDDISDDLLYNHNFRLSDDNYEDRISFELTFTEEVLCECAFGVFCDCFSEEEIYEQELTENEEIDWLIEYANECEYVLNVMGMEDPKEAFYYNLGAAFSKRNKYGLENNMDIDAVQSVREMMYRELGSE